VVDTGEGCDDRNADEQDVCLNSCVSASCGDGIVQMSVEQCDDGDENSDRPGARCRESCTRSTCGDGVIDPGEACDDGAGGSEGCSDSCQLQSAPWAVLVGDTDDQSAELDPEAVGFRCQGSAGGPGSGLLAAMLLATAGLARRRRR